MTGTTRFRAVVGLAVAAATLSVPAAAWACNNPYVTVTPASAQPGDTVHWSIADADLGAEYDGIRIAGRTVVPPGIVTEPKPHGSFVMPDLGEQPRPVEVRAVVSHDHEGGPWGNPGTIQYHPPSPPPLADPPQAGPQEESGAPPPVEELPQRRGEPNGHAAPGGPTRGGGESGDPPRSPGPKPGEPVSTDEPAETAAPVATTSEPRLFAPVQVDVHGVAEAQRDDRPARTRPAQVPLPERVAPVPEIERRAPPVRAPTDGHRPPFLLLVVGAAAICAIFVLLLLRRRGRATGAAALDPFSPIPPDALIEAELQELVAEERHKRLQEERGPKPEEGGEPIRAGPI